MDHWRYARRHLHDDRVHYQIHRINVPFHANRIGLTEIQVESVDKPFDSRLPAKVRRAPMNRSAVKLPIGSLRQILRCDRSETKT